MKSSDTLRIVLKNLRRRPVRSVLTILGVALAVMLLLGIESFSAGMEQALNSGEKQRTLVVYRLNRYCPQTSFLPERYTEEIASVAGVESVLPVKVFLNNCRTNLDMITFHGAPVEDLLAARDIQLLSGDLASFRAEADAALVGRAFAQRRGLSVGDKFRFGDVVVKVAGIFASEDSTQEGLILTHLEFLQRSGPVARLGTVTQFEVKIGDASQARRIAKEIDARLATAEEPTSTRPLASFLERATRDLQEILRFGRAFGIACVLMVMVLVANTIYMSVHERRRELGIFRAMGFRAAHLGRMVLAEAGALAGLGSLIGLAVLLPLLSWSGLAIGVEGIQVSFALSAQVIAQGLLLVLGATLLAALVPAVAAARTNILRSIRGGG